MSPLAATSPEPRRRGSSTDCVGCASKNLWLGLGRPYDSGVPADMGCIAWMTLRCHEYGMYGSVAKYLSAGFPAMYFGTIHALERVDSTTSLRMTLDESSTAMSAALLPMPTTRIFLSMRCSGSHGSM